MNKTEINCRRVAEIENSKLLLKHGKMMLSPLIFMMNPIINLMNGPIMNEREGNTIHRVPKYLRTTQQQQNISRIM